MRLHYYRHSLGNFGDDLNVPLWAHLLPGFFDNRSDDLFLGIGTILNQKLPQASSYTVFGSGAGYGEPPIVDQRWRLLCVRGPMTAEALGQPASLAVTDPALLVRKMLAVVPAGQRRGALFIPHHSSALDADWGRCCRLAGIEFVDPSDPPLRTARRIGKAQYVVTEAMHGAILADALRTPWYAVLTGAHINMRKWSDWLATVGLEPEFDTLPNLFRPLDLTVGRRLALSIRKSLRRRRPTLFSPTCKARAMSTDADLDHATEQLRRIVGRAPQNARLSDDATSHRLLQQLEDRLSALIKG